MKKRLASLILSLTSILFSFSCSLFYLNSLPDEAPLATALPVAAADVLRIGGFGTVNYGSENTFFHGGFDFFPHTNETADFYAIADGVVTEIEKNTGQGYDGDKGARNYRIMIGISKTIKVQYHFEAALNAANQPLTAQEVDDLILVKVGDKVSAGDTIGRLPWRNSSTHVDFGVWGEGGVYEGMPCPLSFFDAVTVQALRDMYTACGGPAADICGD